MEEMQRSRLLFSRRSRWAGTLTAACLLLPILAGCPAKKDTSVESTGPGSVTGMGDKRDATTTGAFAKTDPWLLTTTDPDAVRGNHGIYLSNGYLGATFGASGDAGKDGVAYVAGHYSPEENLQAISNWHDLGLPEPEKGKPYEQTLDMKRGVLITKSGDVTVTALLSAFNPHIALVNVKGLPKPTTPPKSDTGIPDMKVEDVAESDGSWTRFVSDPAVETAKSVPMTFAAHLAHSEAIWASRWQNADITIEGDPEAQQLVHKLQFDLMQSVLPGGSDSIAPEALSGDFYKGHIFWDADIWMYPALLAQQPDLAKNLLDYRYKHLDQAKAIAKNEKLAGADYPWESAATGKETAPGGFTTERHITAGVGWAVWQYYLVTGDKAWLAARGYPVLSAVADHFASRAKKNATTGKYEIKDVFGPDENKGKVNNNTYTNALARYCLLAAGEAAKTLGKPEAPTWAEVAKNIALPFDKAKGAYLARDDDKLESTKQADGELVIYPAKLPMDAKTAAATFDLHAHRPIKSGPAMTSSMHALIAARLGRAKEAEDFFRDSYRPFIRGPFVLFSEKRSLERCVFTTGAGGLLQSVIYGFGGLDYDDWNGTVKRPIALPAGWKKLTITGIRHQGKRYTLTVTPEARTLTEQK